MSKPKLAREFVAPPFSILDAKQGYWRNRVKYWEHEYKLNEIVGRRENRPNRGYSESAKKAGGGDSMSIFDPVLAEIVYLWYMPDSGNRVFDPFSGGPARGVVASSMGYDYYGIDIREEQVNANEELYNDYIGDMNGNAVWEVGDSSSPEIEIPDTDLVFSCPPYHNLEKYSNKEGDLSNVPWGDFMQKYKATIKNMYDALENDRFALFLLQDIRGSDGNMRGLIPKTIMAFENSGFDYYDEIIYYPPLGSLSIRARLNFNASRKIGRAHQNLLVFYKGDLASISDEFSEINSGSVGEQESLTSY